MANGSLSTIANYLTTGNWIDSSTTPAKWNLTSSGSNPQHGTITYNITGNIRDDNGLTAGRAQLVRDAFKYLSNVTGIKFQETTSYSNADIDFSDSSSGAYAGFVDNGRDGFIDFAYVNISNTWSNGSLSRDGYVMQTIIHEIGHALGLGHAGNYNGTASYPGNARFTNDSWQNSIMSYFSQYENTSVDASFALVQTMMPADLLALDRLYGTQSYNGTTFGTASAFTGNTVYGFNTSLSVSNAPILARMSTFSDSNAYTIADGGGIDTLNFSGWSNNQVIRLAVTKASDIQPTVMDVGGMRGNVALAVGTVIENAIGGSGNDSISGNGAANRLEGRAGNDTLFGFSGNDYLFGNGGDDVINGGSHNDHIWGGEGADKLLGDSANDTIFGGEGADAIYGGTGNDSVSGEAGADTIYGGIGNDTLNGNFGSDTIVGESGSDIIFGGDQNDVLRGGQDFDFLYGGQGDDKIFGGKGKDTLFGGKGNDVLTGGTGRDTLDGRFGADQIYAGVDAVRDVILISDVAHSTVGAGRDRIYQFDSGEDVINLSRIDANSSVSGDQGFQYSSGGAADHSIWLSGTANGIVVRGDVDGDATADFEVLVANVPALHNYDFIL